MLAELVIFWQRNTTHEPIQQTNWAHKYAIVHKRRFYFGTHFFNTPKSHLLLQIYPSYESQHLIFIFHKYHKDRFFLSSKKNAAFNKQVKNLQGYAFNKTWEKPVPLQFLQVNSCGDGKVSEGMLRSSEQVPELQTAGSRAHPQPTASAMALSRGIACKSPLLFLTIHQRTICSRLDLLTSSWQLGHPLGSIGAEVIDRWDV